MRKWSGVFLCLVFVAICAGCKNTPENQAVFNGKQVVDSQGIAQILPVKPQRIVSLSIGVDEILIDLVNVERIAALSHYSDDAGISNISDRSGLVKNKVRANVEAVVALQPDMVLLPDWHPPELAQALRDANLPVYVFKSARSIDQIRKNIHDIARLVGEPEKGGAIIANMDALLAEINAKVMKVPTAKRQVVARYSNMGGSGGVGSTFDDICRHAGVDNAAVLAGLDTNGTLTKEQMVQTNPDFLLLPTWDYTEKKDLNRYRMEVQDDPALQTVRAVQNRRLVHIPDRYLSCTSHHIAKGVKSVAQEAYPQLFRQE